MVAVVITIIVSFLITTLFGHVFHWFLHQPLSGKLNVSHMCHHQKLYPPSDFSSKVYRDAGKDSTPKFFLAAATPLILAPIVLWLLGTISLSTMITVLSMEALMGFLHDYLHDAFHISGHWLYGVPVVGRWFRRLVCLHFLHHKKMSSNFGIFTFHFDRLFGTYNTYVATSKAEK